MVNFFSRNYYLLKKNKYITTFAVAIFFGSTSYLIINVENKYSQHYGFILLDKNISASETHFKQIGDITFQLKLVLEKLDANTLLISPSELSLFKKTLKVKLMSVNLVAYSFRSSSDNSAKALQDSILHTTIAIDSSYVESTTSKLIIQLDGINQSLEEAYKYRSILMSHQVFKSPNSNQHLLLLIEISKCNQRIGELIADKNRIDYLIKILNEPPKLINNEAIKPYEGYEKAFAIFGFLFGLVGSFLIFSNSVFRKVKYD
jgi:hypothetical protein